MIDYAEELVRRWELNDPRDSWRHTEDQPPSVGAQSAPLPHWKPTEEMVRDVERMLICDVCGADATSGFGVTLEGIRMGDVGSWRCSEHHPHRKASYTREEWARPRPAWMPYPESVPIDQPSEEVVGS